MIKNYWSLAQMRDHFEFNLILRLANSGRIEAFLEYNLLQNQSIKVAEAMHCNNLFK